MGKKYIIEMKENERLYKAKLDAFNGPVIQEIAGAPYTEPDTGAIREEAFKSGYNSACKVIDVESKTNTAYQKGLSDAWEAARKIYLPTEYGGIPADVLHQIFNNKTASGIFKKVSASEAIEKIRQYEQEQDAEIKVGDEVTPKEAEYDDMIVTRLWKDDYDSDCIDAIGFDGRIGSFLVSRVSKTGKHYEIATILEKMRGEQDGKRREE